MAQRLALGQLRVEKVRHRDGHCSYTVFDSASGLHSGADWYLSKYAGTGSDRTYAYLLVDHLRWHEGLTPESVVFRDLKRYMGAVGAKIPMPYGAPWRVGKRPYQNDALRGAAACLKGFYLRQAELGINTALVQELNLKRMPTQQDKDRVLLGHLKRSMDANPLAPKELKRRHKKMLPDGAREVLLEEVNAARDRVVVEWLSDGGFRIGELWVSTVRTPREA